MKSKEIRPTSAAVHTQEVPWCSHKHSPVKEIQTHLLGGGMLLTCKGNLEKCQVPAELLADNP